MKRILFIASLLMLFLSYSSAQEAGKGGIAFTEEEMARANTAKDCSYMSPFEIETIYYLNLARTCPQKFADLYVKDFYRGKIREQYTRCRDSLYWQLKHMTPIDALLPDPEIAAHCACFADQLVLLKRFTHDRKGTICENSSGECLSHMNHPTPLIFVCGLMVDSGWEKQGFGHRRIMLSNKVHYVGAAMRPSTPPTKKLLVLQLWKSLKGKKNYTYTPPAGEKTDVQKTDAQKSDTQKPDLQKPEPQKTDAQKSDPQKTDNQKTDPQKTDPPKTDAQTAHQDQEDEMEEEDEELEEEDEELEEYLKRLEQEEAEDEEEAEEYIKKLEQEEAEEEKEAEETIKKLEQEDE